MTDTQKKRLFLRAFSITIFVMFGFVVWAHSVDAVSFNVTSTLKSSSTKVSKNGLFETNIMLDTGANKISGASVLVTYPKNILQYQDAQTNAECSSNNFKLSQLLEAKVNEKAGSVKVSRVLIAPDNQLPSGQFCMTTLRFKAKPSFWFWFPWYNRSGSITFSDMSKWQIVGPSGVSSISAGASGSSIQVTETN